MSESNLCVKCRGRGYCGKPCRILSRIKNSFPKSKTHFSGSSPPEIFVGRIGYPAINTGILAPQEQGDKEQMSSPELWHKNKLGIQDVLSMRAKMIYSKFKSRVIDAKKPSKFLKVMQEISIASKSVSTEFFLKRPPKFKISIDTHIPLIGNPAPLKDIRLEENPKVEKKVDYLVSDTDAKSVHAMQELYSSKIETSSIIKILSAGLLGRATLRKLVPTRWAITATDDALSKFLLQKIRFYPEISEIHLFHGDYVGNHYEFLLLPDKFSFEVIEAYIQGSVWNPFSHKTNFSQDWEFFNPRKTYASSVTGAYYTARLALAEYLEKIKRQAYCIVFREERPEYNAPLGVGILRELGRAAFQTLPEKPESINEAFQFMQKRMMLPVSEFADKSILLKNYKKQTRLANWL